MQELYRPAKSQATGARLASLIAIGASLEYRSLAHRASAGDDGGLLDHEEELAFLDGLAGRDAELPEDPLAG